MNSRLHNLKRGDTLVEVLLAMAVLSAILLICWSITNRSTQLGLAARQRIEMVNLLKEQAELLKAGYANQATVDSHTVLPGGLPTDQITDASGTSFCDSNSDLFIGAPGPTNNRFYMGVSATNQLTTTPGMKTIRPDARVWVQYSRVPAMPGDPPGATGYIDMYVRGCWLTSSGQQKLDNSQLVVRLNLR